MTETELQANIIVRPDGCWIWTGSRVRGYGIVKRERFPGFGPTCVPAHRDVWELRVGPIPEGRVLDHLCRSRSCVNPDHLDPITQRENLLRSPTTRASKLAAATHCPAGHAYVGDNVILDPRRGIRSCRACHRDRCSDWNRRAREAKQKIQRDLAEQLAIST